MDNLELCRLNTESLILSVVKKYIPQINLISTVPGIQSFAAIGVLSEIGANMSVFPTSKHLCSWAGLTPQNNKSAGKKKPLVSAVPELTSSRCLFSALFVQSELSAIRKSAIGIFLLKNAEVTGKRLLLSFECCLLPFTTFLKRMSLTIPNCIAGRTLRRNIGQFPWRRLSLFCNAKPIL